MAIAAIKEYCYECGQYRVISPRGYCAQCTAKLIPKGV